MSVPNKPSAHCSTPVMGKVLWRRTTWGNLVRCLKVISKVWEAYVWCGLSRKLSCRSVTSASRPFVHSSRIPKYRTAQWSRFVRATPLSCLDFNLGPANNIFYPLFFCREPQARLICMESHFGSNVHIGNRYWEKLKSGWPKGIQLRHRQCNHGLLGIEGGSVQGLRYLAEFRDGRNYRKLRKRSPPATS